MSPSEPPCSRPIRLGADAEAVLAVQSTGSVTDSAPAWDFATLVRSELGWVWRVLRRLGLSSADADDAAQQVFLVLARRGSEGVSGRLRPFLYGTALRVAANARRSLRRRREVVSDAVGEWPTEQAGPEHLAEQRQARSQLDQLLAELPSELRRVLVLAEIEQLTAKQISELEGLPPGTVASRLRRARAAFYLLLERAQSNPCVERQEP